MPIRITQTGAITGTYARPFVGRIEHTVGIQVALSGLSNKEIDSKGYLKPGIPLTRAGALLGVKSAVKSYSGTGNGVMTGLVADAAAPGETFTVTLKTVQTNAGVFSVVGSISGAQPDATVGVAYDSGEVAFTIADGSTDFVVGDKFIITVAADAVYGVTIEAQKVADDNADATVAALSAVEIAVATIGQVSQAICEDNLDRSFTQDELDGFNAAGCHLVIV